MVPFLLFIDFLVKVSLVKLLRILVFDHVIMLARLNEYGQYEHFIQFASVDEFWQRILQAMFLL